MYSKIRSRFHSGSDIARNENFRILMAIMIFSYTLFGFYPGFPFLTSYQDINIKFTSVLAVTR